MFESWSKNKSLKQYQSFLILKFRLAPKMPVFFLMRYFMPLKLNDFTVQCQWYVIYK